MNSKEERRKFDRFDLSLPTKIEMVTAGGEQEILDLVTTNISAGGAFLRTKEAIPKGTRVVLNLSLSVEWMRQLTGSQALVEVGGTVVRSDPEGTAICFDENYQFLRPI